SCASRRAESAAKPCRAAPAETRGAPAPTGLWICLLLGVYWVAFDPNSFRHLLLYTLYGWVHIGLALGGFIVLYLNLTQVWKLCLVLLLAALVDDTVFYALRHEVTTAILLACLTWGCLARLTGIYYSGRLFSQRLSED
ncbi:MAG: hypothetical protein AAGF24_13455, partial [Cyanobacteria bacterium P01_H01_bin.121]